MDCISSVMGLQEHRQLDGEDSPHDGLCREGMRIIYAPFGRSKAHVFTKSRAIHDTLPERFLRLCYASLSWPRASTSSQRLRRASTLRASTSMTTLHRGHFWVSSGGSRCTGRRRRARRVRMGTDLKILEHRLEALRLNRASWARLRFVRDWSDFQHPVCLA
eukprot:s2254_g4.t1